MYVRAVIFINNIKKIAEGKVIVKKNIKNNIKWNRTEKIL
jgi:hypothetical protein